VSSGSGLPGTMAVELGAYESSLQFDVQESLRIGDLTHGTLFGSIHDVVVAQNGDIYVLDVSNYQILVFDEEGQSLRRFGRQGHGPGEFSARPRIAIADDTLYVVDRYIHTFDLNGNFLYAGRLTEGSNDTFRPAYSVASTAAGLVAVWLHPPGAGGVDGEFVEDTLWVLTRPTSSEIFESPGFPLAGLRQMRIGSSYVSERFGAEPNLAIAPTGHVFYSPGAEYSIDQLDRTGALVERLTANVDPVPIPSALIDSMKKLALDRAATSPRPSEASRDRLIDGIKRTPTAQYRPVIGRLLAGDSGVLLVERRDLDSTDGTPASNWDLLDVTTGKLLGRLKLPRSFTPRQLRNWRIYGTEFRIVPQVVRFDIIR